MPRFFTLFLLAFLLFSANSSVFCAILPPGFAEVVLAEGLNPTDMRRASDGRIFLAQKDGRVMIIHEDGEFHEDPFYTLAVDSYNERGLSGIALHPDFDNNPWVYLYYTVPGENHNRVIRVVAQGDHAVPGSEQLIYDLDPLWATIHNGGSMEFGQDGKLYVTVGDGGDAGGAQDLFSTSGKIMRLEADGSIPSDNPFYNATTGKYRAIYALGFRNPFSMAIDAVSGRIFLSEVGNSAWEEINEVLPGKNYGWPIIEGPLAGQIPPNDYQEPRHFYSHAVGCSAIGAAFSKDNFPNYPPEFLGKFFYADYCSGFIKAIDLNTGNVTGTFITGINRPVKFLFGPNGDFYYLARAGLGGGSDVDNTSSDNGTLVHVFFVGNGEPFMTSQPKPALASVGETPAFTVRTYGNTPMSFRWQINGADIPGADTATVILAPVSLAENGALLRCIASNNLGADTSKTALLTVTSNQRPDPVIAEPDPSYLWRGGDTVRFSGYALDNEEGTLAPSQLTWTVRLHHDVHTHPVLGPESNISNGFWVIPTVYEPDPDVWFRIYLSAQDSGGLLRTVYSEIFPLKKQLSITGPPDLSVNLDGSTLAIPVNTEAVVNLQRSLNAPASFIAGDSIYTFMQWSDGNTDLPRSFLMPDGNLDLVLQYNAAPLSDGIGLLGMYYDDDDFDFSVAPSVIRIDPVVDFDWNNDSPDPLLPVDFFAVRWTGFVQPLFTEDLTFRTITDDGVRLWVNGSLIIDQWIPQGATEWTGELFLEAGKKYPIRMEFYELGGGAVAQLRWSSAHLPSTVIPAKQLFPPLSFLPAKAIGVVWEDANYNGLFDALENPIGGATVLRLDSLGNLIDGRQTDVNGQYQFSIPSPGGRFSFRFILPVDLSNYENTNGLNPGNQTNIQTLNPGEQIALDAGFAPQRASIEGLIWRDDNHNGFPDLNEPGLENVPFALVNSDSVTVRNGISGPQGLFYVDKLLPDSYFMEWINADTSLVPGTGLRANYQTPWFQIAAGTSKYLQISLIPKLVSGTENENLGDLNWTIFPNPAADYLQIGLNEKQGRSLELTLFNALGQNLHQESLQTNTGPNTFKMNTRDLPPGLYHLILENSLGKSVRRFLKG